MTTKKVKSFKSDTKPANQLIMRMVEIRRETANEETKSVEVVIASEHPVERYDDAKREVYREILMMDGVKPRSTRNQLPIVDSHNRSTVRNVLGSVRNLRVEGTEYVGDAVFARDSDSQEAFQKLLDGHLTDFSITAEPNEIRQIRRGETELVRGVEMTGPVDLVTSWTPTDASLVAAGADVTSTVRALLRSYDITNRDHERCEMMNPETMAALVAKGMPADITDAGMALDWLLAQSAPIESAAPVTPAATPTPAPIMSMDKPMETPMAEEPKPEDVTNPIDRALQADKTRRREIVALCGKAGIERALADTWCDENVSLELAREKVLERMVTKPLGTSVAGERIEVTASSEDKTRDAMRCGLLQRAAGSTRSRRNPFGTPDNPEAKPADGYRDFARMPLLRMAETLLVRAGVSTGRMTNRDIAMVALGHFGTIDRMRHAGIMRDAQHTTGTFLHLLLDAQNKSLVDGYEEAAFSFERWVRKGASVSDLKDIHRVKFSEFPDLEDVPEGQPYAEGKTSDDRETYKPGKKGRVMTITWETIVNDDVDALSRVPQMQGTAAKRKQNKACYATLTDNANMRDGVALFHSTHANLAGSAAAISETSLNAAYAAMMVQTNLGGQIINVVPRYLIVPAAISATAEQIKVSQTPPTAGGSAVGTSGITNLYGPNGSRQLEVVVEPQLDANSAAAWYLAADSSQVDTVEITFLEGEESPVIESEWDFDTDVLKQKIRQTFGVGVIDHRGLYKNAGP